MELVVCFAIRIPVRVTLPIVLAACREMALLAFEVKRCVPGQPGKPCRRVRFDHLFPVVRIIDAVKLLVPETFDHPIKTCCMCIYYIVLCWVTSLLLSYPCLFVSLLCSLFLFKGPQGFERSFLPLCNACHAADIHALVRSLAAQGQEALPSLPLPQQDASIVRPT